MDEAHNHIERIAHLTSENISSQSGHFDAMYKVIFVGDAGTKPLFSIVFVSDNLSYL